MIPTNRLYTDRADLYSMIANDREFLQEVRSMGILDLCGGGRFVELFAGPAYHSRVLQQAGWTGTIDAVDTSQQMAAIARAAGFAGSYHCDDAIGRLAQLEAVDIVCIPRFSVVLVDADYVCRLFAAIRKAMKDNARLFIEVHPDAARETDWESLTIRERRVYHGSTEVLCTWPQSVCEVPGIANAVDMTVCVSVTEVSGEPEHHYFVSREYLHTEADLVLWAELAGLEIDPTRGFTTASGKFIAFSPTQVQRVPPELLRSAFSARFDLSSEEARESAIHLSGLDITKHDSPLSLHVYNLL